MTLDELTGVTTSAPATYGPRLRALAVYFLHVQHLPVARTAALLAEVYGICVSEGFLVGVLADAGLKASPFTKKVRDALVEADVAHFDETSVRVAGSLWWLHSASTDKLTLLGAYACRGTKAMADLGVLPTFAGTAVHDGFFPYRRYDATHALCNAHHLRELVAVTDRDPAQTWATDLIEALRAGNRAAHQARAKGQHELPAEDLAQLQVRYAELIDAGWAANPGPPPTGKHGAPKLGPTGSLLRRLDERRQEVLRFATDLAVPFTKPQDRPAGRRRRTRRRRKPPTAPPARRPGRCCRCYPGRGPRRPAAQPLRPRRRCCPR